MTGILDDTVMTEDVVVVVVVVDDDDDDDDDDVFWATRSFWYEIRKKCQARRHLANEITTCDEQNHIANANVCPM